MTSSVRILTTASVDSTPSIVLSAPNGDKIIVNCGEGCQRAFLESAGLKLKSVKRICVTHLHPSAVGGLPGMLLTAADSVESAHLAQAATLQQKQIQQQQLLQRQQQLLQRQQQQQQQQQQQHNQETKTSSSSSSSASHNNNNGNSETQAINQGNHNNNNHNNKKRPNNSNSNSNGSNGMSHVNAGIEIHGPFGTQTMIHSLRHFMRRDRFEFRVKQGEGKSPIPTTTTTTTSTQQDDLPKHKKQKKKKSTTVDPPVVDFTIEAMAMQHVLDDGNSIPIQSYIFQTPPLVGRFRPDLAQQLGIPKGPLYAQLKNGHSVTFVATDDNQERTVHSHQVLEIGHPHGIALAVIYCPSQQVLHQLQHECPKPLTIFQTKNQTTTTTSTIPSLDVMIHMTPMSIAQSTTYLDWIQSFDDKTQHIWLDVGQQQQHSATPYMSSSLGGMMRSLIHPTIYPSPISNHQEYSGPTISNDNNNNNTATCCFITGERDLEYILIPRTKKGIIRDRSVQQWWLEGIQEAKALVEASGAIQAAATITEKFIMTSPSATIPSTTTTTTTTTFTGEEILFTGTGSALPSKHRNVTGICLTLGPNKRMLLDCGEGTVGQILRAHHSDLSSSSSSTSSTSADATTALLNTIQAVWISHPHADHHLGILRLLSERTCTTEPLLLIATPNMFAFLQEYQSVDPTIRNKYKTINCYDLLWPKLQSSSEIKEILLSRLGITAMSTVLVSHCRDAFAIVMDCGPTTTTTSTTTTTTCAGGLGRVAYSGDCRPSTKFADMALHADIVIHEATFENGMEEEAVLKKHSTVGEALSIAKRMKAKAIVLTHFSQRYPKIPPLLLSTSSSSSSSSSSFANKTTSTMPKGNNDNNHDNDNGEEDKGEAENEEQIPIVVAFDFMKISPTSIPLASKLTTALRLLYPEEDDKDERTNDDNDDNDDSGNLDATKIMAVPGMFAKSELYL